MGKVVGILHDDTIVTTKTVPSVQPPHIRDVVAEVRDGAMVPEVRGTVQTIELRDQVEVEQ